MKRKKDEKREKIIISGEKKDERYPTFLVVDEAHNLVPQKPESIAEKGVLELFKKIAAEGRKEGTFLILCSQRPQKLNTDVLSECDNICVMKLSNERDIETLTGIFHTKDPAKLKEK